MSTVNYRFDKEIPIIKNIDVAVIGSGPGGLGAAVFAARHGAKTLIVERYGYPGGMATNGEVHPFMPNHAFGEPLDRPVYGEWIEKMATYASVEPGSPIPEGQHHGCISKEAAILAAEDLLLETGVDALYHHNLVDVIMDGRKILHAIFASKSGYVAVVAKQFVDCTGDGDLAAMAGCEFEFGGPGGYCQPMTLCFKLNRVNRSKLTGTEHNWRKEITRLFQKAKEEGRLDCPREDVLAFDWLDNDTIHFNTTRVIKKSAVDGLELSEAEIIARKQVRQLFKLFRTEMSGFENAQIASIAHHIGVRESRRIKGLNYVTRSSFEHAEKFEDAIARVNYPIDIHSPDGAGTELVHLPQNEWYEIPYGCIVSKDCDNLTVGGRPISVDHALHSSSRVMPPAITVGQAAGLAAAECAKRGVSPKDLDGVDVRRMMLEKGARLD